MRISDWSSDVCSSDRRGGHGGEKEQEEGRDPIHVPSFRLDGESLMVACGDRHASWRCLMRPCASQSLASVRFYMHEGNGSATARQRPSFQIGRASCRESMCQYV